MNADARRTRSRFDARRRAKLCVLFLTALAVALVAPDATAQRRTAGAGESGTGGTITGRVVGEEGQPLSNVRIFATRVGGAQSFGAGATSDDEGKFALRNLANGAYLVNAFAPNYLLDPEPSDQPNNRIYHHAGDSLALRMIKGGVITGTVTDTNGEPVVGLFVEAARVRYADGRALREGSGGRIWQPRLTDDRGVYRIYGLRAGAYIIRAGGKPSFGVLTPYDLNAPTFYPSTTRDAATEVNVQAGQETVGVDIRYRGEAGRTISGTVSGALPPTSPTSGGIIIALKHVAATAPEQFAPLQPGNNGFAFDGIADGDYDLLARTLSPRDESAAASLPQRVRLRGRDATGITLLLTPLASVSGQLLFDPPATPLDGKASCPPPARAPRAGEFIIALTRRDEAGAADQSPDFFNGTNETAPDDKGIFQLRNLRGGRYQLLVRPPTPDFYLRAVALARTPAQSASAVPTQTTPATAAPPVPAKSAPPATTATTTHAQVASDAARAALTLRAGERLAGLNIHVAPGASSVRGRVVGSTETAPANAPPDASNARVSHAAASSGASPHAAHAGASPETVDAGASAEINSLRVYLFPAEREQAGNALRYAESGVATDGTFAFNNLAPGRYRLLARPAHGGTVEDATRPLAQDADALRARLRREAEASSVTLDLAPCQHVADFVLRRALK